MAHYEISPNGKTVYFVHNGTRFKTSKWGVEKESFQNKIDSVKAEIAALKKEIERIKNNQK